MRTVFQTFILGMAIFSMFFGGGNLTFPLWIGSESTSVLISSFGFILSGVLLPFYGILVSLYFKGNYEELLSGFGKHFGSLLIFALLLFWIPLGSGPRCNQLAYGAFICQTKLDMIPLWAYSAFYSVVVYLLTFRENRIIEILGKFLTPVLIFLLIFFIAAIFHATAGQSIADPTSSSSWKELSSAFFAGYQTMDFIAAIFFSSAVISLIKKQEKFSFAFVRNACLFAITLLSLVYIGLIFVGSVNGTILSEVPRDRLLATIGEISLDKQFGVIILLIISLSVLSTSIALSLVFSDYLRKNIFKNKFSHATCLAISIFLSFLLSIIGFDSLAVIISYATTLLYPCLLILTTVSFCKGYFKKKTFAEISS